MHALQRWRFAFWLSWRNLQRWRWRFLCSAALLAIGVAMMLFYAAETEVSTQRSIQQVEPLPMPYADLVVTLKEGRAPVEPQDWPEEYLAVFSQNSLRPSQIYERVEEGMGVQLQSAAQRFEALGLKVDSAFFALPEGQLSGRTPNQSGEILLTADLALRLNCGLGQRLTVTAWQGSGMQTHLLYRSFFVVGIFATESSVAPALICYDDAVALKGSSVPNRVLLNYQREEATLEHLLALAHHFYPEALMLSSATPQELAEELMRQYYSSSSGIVVLIALFSCLGVLTVTQLTFFERRQEMAALKAMGTSTAQLSWILILEQIYAELLGLIFSAALLAVLVIVTPWLREIPLSRFSQLLLPPLLQTLVASGIALTFPLLTIRVASTDQLLHLRLIPLRVTETDHLEKPSVVLINRELEENVRIIKAIPQETASVFFLHRQGDYVKKGEVLARYESLGGYVAQEWRAFCDGEIVEQNEGGLIAIRPDDPQAPFYPYSSEAYRMAALSIASIHRGKRMAREAELAGETRAEVRVHFPTASEADPKEVPEGVSRAWQLSRQLEKDAKAVAPKRRRFGMLPQVALVFASLVLLYGVLLRVAETQGRALPLTPHLTYELRLEPIRDELRAEGTLNYGDVRTLSTLRSGRIEDLFLAASAQVVAGQPILRLSNPQLEAELRAAEQEMSRAQLAYSALSLQPASWQQAEREAELRRQEAEELRRKQERLLLRAPADGVVIALYAQIGESVEIGEQLLAFRDLSREDVSAARIELLRAEEELRAVELERQRLQVFSTGEGIVEDLYVRPGQFVEVGQEMALLGSLSGALEVERLAQRQAELLVAEAERELQQLSVRAPFAGTLHGLKLEAGDMVRAGQELARISDTSTWAVEVRLPQSTIASIARGAAAELRTGSGFVFSGWVEEIAPEGETDDATRAVTFALRVEAPTQPGLFSGQRVEVALDTTDATASRISGLKGIVAPSRIEILTASVDGSVAQVAVENGASVGQDQLLMQLESAAVQQMVLQAKGERAKLGRKVIHSEVIAEVREIYVSPGQRVTEGQLLLSLSSAALEAQYAHWQDVVQQLRRDGASNTDLFCSESGQIAQLFVAEGERVVAGQPLLQLESADLRYRLQIAEAEALKAEATYEAARLNPLAGELGQAQITLEQARLNWQRASQAVESLQLIVPEAGWLELAQPLTPGQELSSATTLAYLQSLEHIELLIQVDELVLARLQIGDVADLAVAALPGESFQGRIREIAAEGRLVQGTPVYDVYIELPRDPRMRAGMSCSATLLFGQVDFGLVLPKDYLRREARDGRIHYSVDLLVGGQKRSVEVEIGIETATLVEIKSGLREGDIALKEMPP